MHLIFLWMHLVSAANSKIKLVSYLQLWHFLSMEFEWNLVSIPKYIKFLWLFTPTQLISLTPKKSTATIFYLRQKIKIISWKLDLVTGKESSVRPKPLFCFRSDTETKTQIGQYRNQYQNHISKGKSSYQ